MYCPKCGKEINDNVKFCKYCGATIKVAQAQNPSQSQPPIQSTESNDFQSQPPIQKVEPNDFQPQSPIQKAEPNASQSQPQVYEAAPTPSGRNYAQGAGVGIADEIKKVKELFDIGAISEEEYETQRTRLLDQNIVNLAPVESYPSNHQGNNQNAYIPSPELALKSHKIFRVLVIVSLVLSLSGIVLIYREVLNQSSFLIATITRIIYDLLPVIIIIPLLIMCISKYPNGYYLRSLRRLLLIPAILIIISIISIIFIALSYFSFSWFLLMALDIVLAVILIGIAVTKNPSKIWLLIMAILSALISISILVDTIYALIDPLFYSPEDFYIMMEWIKGMSYTLLSISLIVLIQGVYKKLPSNYS